MAPAGNWKLNAGTSKAQGAIEQPSVATRTLRGQGATEYLLILGVLLLIAVVAASLLGYLPGVSGDARKETYVAQLRAGEPFSIEDHKSVGGKLSISFANKKGNELDLTHIILSAGNIGLTQSTGGLSEFSGGMRRVLTFDVPCVDGTREFEIILVYTEGGVQKEEKLNGKIVVDSCTTDVLCTAVIGGQCSVDGDCCAGICDAGTCKNEDQGECDSDGDCVNGHCNPFTHFCDPRPPENCSPLCMLEDASVVCGETIAGAECSGWEDANPQCGVLPDCSGRYSDCSLLCGGVCAGWLAECGGGVPCCDGFDCSNGFCIEDPDNPTPACGGTYDACNATTCCTDNYCNQTVSGECRMCKTYGTCNATTTGNCCSGYACGTGYSAMDVPRVGTECGLPDESACSLGSQCLNGTCYDGSCKNCNTNNVCDKNNVNADCCFGKLCLANQTGDYTCQNAVNVSGAYEYLYDTSWNMGGNPAVIYKAYSNGTTVYTKDFAGTVGMVCAENAECLSNSCVGGICTMQIEGSWCDCVPGGGYSSCVCPAPGNICNPYNYTCVSMLNTPAASYGYLCKNTSLCYQQCYNTFPTTGEIYTNCNQIYNVCRKGGEPCLYAGNEIDAQCCSNNCIGGICAAQSSGSWCQISTYTPDWPFGNSSTVPEAIRCQLPLACTWNTTTTPFCS